MRDNKELLLAHKTMDRVTLVESANIMLSPQFYTLKKEALPVKYAYQAKKIAPSLFEGLLEDDGEYDYYVSKEDKGWSFIAYDTKKIMTFLESKGIYEAKVSKLFFAQQAVDALVYPVALNETEALAVHNGTVVQIPISALGLEERTTAKLDSSFVPKGGVSPQGGDTGSILTQKQALSLAAIFILFAGIFFVEAKRFGGDSQESIEELESLYVSYPALQSNYTRQGIVDKYRTMDKNERKKRDTVKAFSSMIFKGVTLTSLNVNEQAFKVNFTCSSESVAKRVKGLAKKAKYAVASVNGSMDLSIEGAL